jgi:hypothetical protein
MGQAPAPRAGASWILGIRSRKYLLGNRGQMRGRGINMTIIGILYLGVGEEVATHAVGENDNGPGAGARSRRQLRLGEAWGYAAENIYRELALR